MRNSINKKLITIAIISGLSLLTAQTTIARHSFGPDGPTQNQENDQTDQSPRESGQGQDKSASFMMTRMDFDEDGIVTVNDLYSQNQERSSRHFERMDQDDDGYISIDEFSSRGHKESKQQQNDIDQDALELCIEQTTGITLGNHLDPEDKFLQIDTDGDGYLSEEELLYDGEIHAQERFAEIDTDDNGILSEDEVTTHIEQRQLVREAHKSCQDEQVLSDLI